MRKLFLLCLLLYGWTAPAQELRSLNKRATTRAVIIGISDYLDPEIRDLSYADRDAGLFADFLRSRSGGQLRDEQIRLLTNQQATIAGIGSALEWLSAASRAGDQAILYFSGHGDVETRNEREKGYLIAYDTPGNNYRLNAIDLQYLNETVVTDLSRKGVKVILITDACHSGKLAGEGIGGREITAAELMKRFGNEIRIMSCQPYELSLEGSKWGNGRGVFSYFLLDGLKGRADEDGDQRVDLYELEQFLKERVRESTGRAQHPDVFGGRKEETLFTIDETVAASLRDVEKTDIQAGFEKEVLAKLASAEGYANYANFLGALKAGDLLGAEGSALDYYEALYQDTTFLPLRGILDERLTTALIDSAQQALLAYLQTDPQELSQRERFDQKYARFPAYLGKAADILGPKDPRYRATLAKQYYFEGLVLRMQAQQRARSDSLFQLALHKQEKALELEDRAAYIFNELGYLLLELGEAEKGMGKLRQAVELSPTWAIPYNNLAVGYRQQDSLEPAKAAYLQAIALKPDFASAYANLGNLLAALEQPDSAETLYRQAINLDTGIAENYLYLGLLLSEQEGREQEAADVYFQALQIRPQYPEAYLELGNLYDARGQTDIAEQHYNKAIEQNPAFAEAYRNLGILYYNNKRLEEAERMFRKAVDADPGFVPAYESLALLYLGDWKKTSALVRTASLGNAEKTGLLHNVAFSAFQSSIFDHALKAFHLAIEIDPGNPESYYLLSSFYALRGQEREALAWLNKTLVKARITGVDYFETISQDDNLALLRQSKRYQAIMVKYFPGRGE